MVCPNINAESWKKLEGKVGKKKAYEMWASNGFETPDSSSLHDSIEGSNSFPSILSAIRASKEARIGATTNLNLSDSHRAIFSEFIGAREMPKSMLLDELQGYIAHVSKESVDGKVVKMGRQYLVKTPQQVERYFDSKEEADKYVAGSNTYEVFIGDKKVGSFSYDGSVVSNVEGGNRVAIAAAHRVISENPKATIDVKGNVSPIPAPAFSSAPSSDRRMEALMDILSKSGIPVVSIQRWQELSGEKASVHSMADTTRKLIAVKEGASTEMLSEEVAHMAVAALENSDVDAMIPMVEQTAEWDSNKEAYIAAYEGDMRKAKVEVLGKLLSKHVLKNIEAANQVPPTLMRRLRDAWRRFLSMFSSSNSLSQRLDAIAKDVVAKGIDVSNVKDQGIYFFLETSDFVKNFSDIIKSLEIRIEALRQRNKSVSVADQVDRLETEIKELKEAEMTDAYGYGFVRFLNYLAEDINAVMNYIRQVDNKLRTVTPEELMQLSDFIDYYEPYVKNIKQFTIYGDVSRFNANDIDVMDRMADDAIQAFHRIRFFRSSHREQQFLDIVRSWWAEELQIDINDPNLDQQITILTGGYDMVEAARKLSADGNVMQWWFGSLKNASDPLLRLVYSKVMRADQRVHLSNLEFGKDLTNKLNELDITNQDRLIERDQGKRTGHYVEEYAVRAFNNAKTKFFEGLWVKYKLSDNAETRALEMEQWEANAIGNPNSTEAQELAAYKLEIAEWFASNTVRKSAAEIKNIMQARRAMFSQEQFDEWMKMNMPTITLPNGNSFVQYKGELVSPSDGRKVRFRGKDVFTKNWKSTQYEQLTNNEKEFIDYVKMKKMETQSMLPGKYDVARMPQMTDKIAQIVKFKRDNAGKRIRDNIVDAITDRDHEDLEIFGNSVMRPDGSRAKYVPIYFTRLLGSPEMTYEQRLEETDKISTDIVSGLTAFHEMASRFSELSKLAASFELIAEQAGQREYQKRNGEIIAGSSTAIQKQMRTFIDMQVYGMHLVGAENLPEGIDKALTFSKDNKVSQFLGLAGKKINLKKLLKKLGEYVRANNLGLNFFTTASNFVQSYVYNRIEDMVKQYTSLESALFAEKEFWRNFPHVISETGKIVKTNKMHLLMEAVGVAGDTRSIFANTDFSRLSRRAIETGLYFSYEMIDYYRNARVTMSVMHNYRIAHDGKMYSKKEYQGVYPAGNFDALPTIYNMISVDRNGNIVFPGVTQADKQAFQDKFVRLASRIKHVSQTIDGKLDRLDYAAAHQHFIGHLLTIHRGWLIQGIERRLKSRGINVATGDMEEGYWITTVDFLKKTIMHPNRVNFIRAGIENWNNLSPMERENINRMIWEFGYAMMTMAVAIIMNGLSDDEDEYAYDIAAYMANRALLEVGAFIPPIFVSEISNTIANPIVPMRHIELMMDFPDFFFGSDVIERGQWKDFTKRERAIARLAPGVKGLALIRDPKSANQFLRNKPLRTVPFELYERLQ